MPSSFVALKSNGSVIDDVVLSDLNPRRGVELTIAMEQMCGEGFEGLGFAAENLQ